MDDNKVAQLEAQVQLALSQAKRVNRESRKVVQQLGQLIDEVNDLQIINHKENNDNRNNN